MLGRSLGFPEPDFHQAAVTGRFHREIGDALRLLPYRLAAGPARHWAPARDYDAFQSEYVRLFEMGAHGQRPCLLFSGHYGSDRLRTMEELVRFYNYFGLRLAGGIMPDHVTVELEFMRQLTEQEAKARQAGGETESFLVAQRDFLGRHLNGWWPQAVAGAGSLRPQRYYQSLIALVSRFLSAESRYLDEAVRAG